MTKKNYLNSLPTVNGARIDDFSPQHLAEKYARRESEYKEQKEIIRRLKIQNKKLLEQVVSLKGRLKKKNVEQAKVVEKLNDLKKINNSLTETLGGYHRRRKDNFTSGIKSRD
jgi:predicted nuclease with TOPRIM domain